MYYPNDWYTYFPMVLCLNDSLLDLVASEDTSLLASRKQYCRSITLNVTVAQTPQLGSMFEQHDLSAMVLVQCILGLLHGDLKYVAMTNQTAYRQQRPVELSLKLYQATY